MKSTNTRTSVAEAPLPQSTGRDLASLDELAGEAAVSRRFLELEIGRGRLIAIHLSNRVLRVRRRDWVSYLDSNSSAKRGR